MRAWTLTALFAAYTLTSAAGLLMLRVGLPGLRTAYADGGLVSRDSAFAVVGVVAYGASFVFWLVLLAQLPLAKAYPVAVGLTLAATAVGAHLLLGETLSVLNVLGILAVFSGIVMITLS